MENIKDYLKKIREVQGFARVRAEELLYARGCKDYYEFSGIEFESDEIIVQFDDGRYTDCPDRDSVSLSIEELEKTDSEWKEYIKQATEETASKVKALKEKEEKITREAKEREFNRLKKDLGY